MMKQDSLLIVGYVGHGWLSPDRSYQIAAGSDVPPWDVFDPQLRWSVMQDMLQEIDNDVLILLDSCYASGCITAVDTTKSKGKIEIIAASGYGETAFVPEKVRTMWSRHARTFNKELVTQLKVKAEKSLPFTAPNLHRGLVQQIIHSNFDTHAHTWWRTPDTGSLLAWERSWSGEDSAEKSFQMIQPRMRWPEWKRLRILNLELVKRSREEVGRFLEIRQRTEGKTGIAIDVASSEDMEVALLLCKQLESVMEVKKLTGNAGTANFSGEI